MKQIGIGLLGAGWMGELHTGAYKRVLDHFPDLGVRPRLVIAADHTPERAADARDRLGYAEATTDWREVLAHPDVGAVSITTPNFMHREMALAAAAAGKHFWGEKPLGRFPAETAEIAAAAEAAGVMTTVGFN
jgi:predicted dehydrogenase